MRKVCIAVLLLLACFFASPSLARQSDKPTTVIASYYQYGTMTASGERYNPNGFTAAHRTFKFGTRLRVTNIKNGKSVIVRVNDRGPFIKKRGLDLSRGAARQLDMLKMGTCKVTIVKL